MPDKITVLVVDDNPVNRQYFSMSLNKSGYDVILAENGFEAVEQAKNRRFDMILIDIRMPELDGYEATRIIKSIENHQDTPIIATSAEAIQPKNASLFNEFLMKPISPKTLNATVKKHCKIENLEVFNQANALKYTYNDKEMMVKLIVLFTDDLPVQFRILEQLLKEKKSQECTDIIHKVRGSCKACGADDLDKQLQTLSQIIKNNNSKEEIKQFEAVKNAAAEYLKSTAGLRLQ